jgi:hypothetical protein
LPGLLSETHRVFPRIVYLNDSPAHPLRSGNEMFILNPKEKLIK